MRLKNSGLYNTGFYLFIAFCLAGIFATSCKREEFSNDPGAKLAFSADTILFDTVFSKLGGGPFPRSVNKRLLVYNRNKKSIKTTIQLGKGATSAYRINIDGNKTTSVTDYEIRGEDSIYVFVEVSVDPGNLNNPFIVEDSIVFFTNGNTQHIPLRAWGQDAYYFNDSILGCNVVWNDKTKPYVIYKSVLVPQNCKLTIGDGVKVYSDVGSYIYVQGTLEVNGTKDNRTTFQGARLGKDFTELPGQWGGIHFLQTSRNNSIRFADVVNGIIGIRSDSLSVNANPKVTVENTLVKNMSAVGVLGYTSNIKMVNCCVNNCGQYTFAGDLGGTYEMTHCTFASYNGTFTRKDESFALSNADYKNPQGTVFKNPLNFIIRNTIIYGSLKEELLIFRGGQGTVTAVFDNNIVRTQIQGFPTTNKINVDPKFKDILQLDFSLDTLSPAKDAGGVLGILNDLEGKTRDAQPDIGAYERVE